MNIDYLSIPSQMSLKEDDVLLIAGNVTKLALHEKKHKRSFNIQAFINGFKEQLPNGTLLFHAYTDNIISGDTFHYRKSKPNTGSLSVAAWKDREFVRTYDPFHSFMVFGKNAESLQKANYISTFGPGSVFEWLHKNNAKMLFIDVSLNDSFTFVHYCEEKTTIPYRKHIKHRIRIIDENDNEKIEEKLFYTRKCGYINYLYELDNVLVDKNITKCYSFNNISFKVMDLSEAYEIIKDNILNDHASLLHRFSYKIFLKEILRKTYRFFNPRKPIVVN